MWAYTPQHCDIPGLDFLIPQCDNVGFLVFYPPKMLTLKMTAYLVQLNLETTG